MTPDNETATEAIIGIDPGATGGIACVVLAPGFAPRLVFAEPMPCTGTKTTRMVDAPVAVALMKKGLRRSARRGAGTIVQEVAQAMTKKEGPRQGIVSMFRYGRLAGGVDACARIAAGPWTRLECAYPASWKRAMGIGSDKNKALEFATRRFGRKAEETWWPRKGLHGPAEAALIALWWAERNILPSSKGKGL